MNEWRLSMSTRKLAVLFLELFEKIIYVLYINQYLLFTDVS